LQEKFVDAVVERGVDIGDGRALVVGRRKAFAGLDEFVSNRNGLTIGVDGAPDVGGCR
jgi:hypothetical protein